MWWKLRILWIIKHYRLLKHYYIQSRFLLIYVFVRYGFLDQTSKQICLHPSRFLPASVNLYSNENPQHLSLYNLPSTNVVFLLGFLIILSSLYFFNILAHSSFFLLISYSMYGLLKRPLSSALYFLRHSIVCESRHGPYICFDNFFQKLSVLVL